MRTIQNMGSTKTAQAFTDRFVKVAASFGSLRRALGDKIKPMPGSRLSQLRAKKQIPVGTSRQMRKYEKIRIGEQANKDVIDRAKRIKGKETQPTALGRFMRRHPIMAGLGTYGAARVAFGNPAQQPDPQVVQPQVY